jgi:hypothetical protein
MYGWRVAMEGPAAGQPLTPTLSPEYRGEGVYLARAAPFSNLFHPSSLL